MKLSLTVAIALTGFSIAGLLMCVSTFFGIGARANPALVDTSFPTKAIIGALIFVGSTVILLAGYRWKRRTTAWSLAVFGLPIAAFGWSYYSIAIILSDPLALFPIPLGVGLAIAHGFKLVDVFKEEVMTRKNVEALKNARTP